MTYKDKVARLKTLTAEQRTYLDATVPQRVAENPSFDFKTDRHYTERQHEIERLGRETADRPASGAGREDTIGVSPADQLRYGYDYQRPASGSPSFDRRSSWEQDQLRALATLFRGGPNVIESDHRGILQRASLSTASGAVGGYLVPNFVQATVIQDLAKFQTVRRLGASVMPLQGNENVPVVNDPDAAFISEATAIASGLSQTDPTFGAVEIRPSLVYATTNFSWHVQAFSPANVEEEIRKSFGRAIAKTVAAKFLNGSGTNEPQGVVGAAGTGVTAASETVFTADELTALWYSLDPWFQQDAAWIVAPEAATLIRTFESANGHPLWVPNLRDGGDQLFGRPVVIDPNMQGLTASQRPVIVGSMSEAYLIAESNIFVVVDPYSRHRNAENVVTFYQFVDGRVRRADAAKALVMLAE
jgi:HK97 family phage major capsid protein